MSREYPPGYLAELPVLPTTNRVPDHGQPGGGASSVITLVVLAVIVVGVAALSRRSVPAALAPAAAPALRTLDERFARGEVDEAEYIERRDLLTRR
jgi:putative membrane protein